LDIEGEVIGNSLLGLKAAICLENSQIAPKNLLFRKNRDSLQALRLKMPVFSLFMIVETGQ